MANYYYVKNSIKPISIGFEGENDARTIVFDISRWIEDYGNGTALLVHQRPGDAEPYPCATEQKAGTIEWAVQQADLVTGGYGRAQISYKVGDNIVARSPIYKTVACASISAAEAGEPGQDWVNDVLDAAAQAETSATNAANSAETAKQAETAATQAATSAAADANAAAQSEANANKSASAAAGSAETAQTAATTATDAAGQAQASQTAAAGSASAAAGSAETAQTAATTATDAAGQAQASQTAAAGSASAAAESATQAAGSQTAAKNSEDAAAGSATDAAESASAALTSQNAAKTSEDNAKNSETQAAASASAADQSEQSAAQSANAAKQSAEQSAQAAADAGQIVKDAETAAIAAIDEAEATAVSKVSLAGQSQVDAVNAAGTSAVSDIGAAKTDALTGIDTAKTDAVGAVNTAGTQAASDAQTAITAAKNQAVSGIESAGQSAVEAVEEAQTTAVEAVGTAQTNAVQAVQNAGTAEIEKINDILPVPTEADNGKVLTVVDGKWTALEPSITNWERVQLIVRAGLAPQYFPAGYEFITHDSIEDTDIVWRVVGHDTIKAADETLTHTMILEAKYVYSKSTGSYISLQFDAQEALYYAKEELLAGTYNFTLLENYDTTYGGGKTYSFTLAKPVPAGGVIMFPWGYNQQASEVKISTYATQADTTAIETVPVTEGSEGTSLGTADGKTENMNHTHRIRYGSNNYAQSAIKQWLSSKEAVGNVWKPQTKFDRPPTWANSRAGFVAGLPEDFLSVVQTAIVPCRTNSIFEVDSLDGTEFAINQIYNLEEKFFLLSRPEIYGTWDNSDYKDGEQLDFYKGLTDAERIKYDPSGSARYCWLRSPDPGYASDVRTVSTSGALSNGSARSAFAAASACIIA